MNQLECAEYLDKELPQCLEVWDFPDIERIACKYRDETLPVPAMSDRNFQLLVEEHNKVVEILRALTKTVLRV